MSCSSDEFNTITDTETPIGTEPTVINEDSFNLIYENSITAGSLNSFFNNALISDVSNNIRRNNAIRITDYDKTNNRIKTNYVNIQDLIVKASNNQSWFITQNSEASTVVEIESIDTNEGWITFGKTYLGTFNTNVGAIVEFFNPFVNYQIIGDSPLFDPYPTTVTDGDFNYIQSGGVFEKSNGTYVLLTPIVFGAHSKRSIYYATSSNLEDWDFQNKKILGTETISFAKTNGNVFSVDNPFKLDDGRLLVLLGVEQPNGNYTSAYMIIDEDLKILQQPKEIMIPGWHGLSQNSFPLSITKFNNEYRILFHKRSPRFIDREIHELIVFDLFDALDFNTSIVSSKLIHRGSLSHGYLRGKADDASYLQFNSELYVIVGGEELRSNYLTSINRQYGLMRLNQGVWKHDFRSPLLVNPVQLHNKYTIYNWAWDHLGGFISPILKDDKLYVFMAFGTDIPDYYLGGVKISLK